MLTKTYLKENKLIVEADKETVRLVVDILNESYRDGEGWTTEKGLVSGDRATEGMIKDEVNSGYKYYLYRHENDYVGCFSINQKEGTAEIGGLGIKSKYQGAGFGKFLLNKAEGISISLPGVERLVVSVLAPRSELISFYKRRGYHATNVTYPFPEHRGVGTSLVDDLQVVVLEKGIE